MITMIEKLGRWYVFTFGYRKFKIHQKHVVNDVINIIKIDNSTMHIFIYGIQDIAKTIPDDVIKVDDKYITCKNNIIDWLHKDEYEYLVDMEKICDQVDKLSAHVKTLMIASGSLSKDYDGEFP